MDSAAGEKKIDGNGSDRADREEFRRGEINEWGSVLHRLEATHCKQLRFPKKF